MTEHVRLSLWRCGKYPIHLVTSRDHTNTHPSPVSQAERVQRSARDVILGKNPINFHTQLDHVVSMETGSSPSLSVSSVFNNPCRLWIEVSST